MGGGEGDHRGCVERVVAAGIGSGLLGGIAGASVASFRVRAPAIPSPPALPPPSRSPSASPVPPFFVSRNPRREGLRFWGGGFPGGGVIERLCVDLASPVSPPPPPFPPRPTSLAGPAL